MYLLITIIITNGLSDIFFDKTKNIHECRKQREENIKWQNEITKTQSFCVKLVK